MFTYRCELEFERYYTGGGWLSTNLTEANGPGDVRFHNYSYVYVDVHRKRVNCAFNFNDSSIYSRKRYAQVQLSSFHKRELVWMDRGLERGVTDCAWAEIYNFWSENPEKWRYPSFLTNSAVNISVACYFVPSKVSSKD